MVVVCAVGAGGTKPPRGEVVIGFSDIANGDALWDWNAAAMRDATLIHNDILRDLMKKHGGTPASSTDSSATLVAKLRASTQF